MLSSGPAWCFDVLPALPEPLNREHLRCLKALVKRTLGTLALLTIFAGVAWMVTYSHRSASMRVHVQEAAWITARKISGAKRREFSKCPSPSRT